MVGGGAVLQPVPWSSLATGVERTSSSLAVLSQQDRVTFCISAGEDTLVAGDAELGAVQGCALQSAGP